MSFSFDSKQYAFKDIQAVIAGENVAEFAEVKFGSKRDKEYSYYRGDKAHSIQWGNIENSGSIKLSQAAVERLMDKAPEQDITQLQINVVIAFAPELGTKRTTFTLLAVEFTEWEIGMAQGDKKAEIDLPIMFLRVAKG